MITFRVSARRETGGLTALAAILAAGLLVGGCGGSAPAPSAATSREPISVPPVSFVAPTGESSASPSEAGGATIRVVNVWAEPGKAGPTVRLRMLGQTDQPPLVEAAPGTVSSFVPIPKAQFGEGPAEVEVVRADAGPSERGVGLGSAQSGDRITVIVHGESRDGSIAIAANTTWEHGQPTTGLPWPSTAPDKAMLMVYPGALLALPADAQSIALAATDGRCLIKADTGQQDTGGFGGNVPAYYAIDAGSTEIAVAHQPSGTCKLEPTIGKVQVQAAAGQRLALLPWGQGADQIKLLVIDMGMP